LKKSPKVPVVTAATSIGSAVSVSNVFGFERICPEA
jgi:hypothetical protein